jgi:hypothetical protein
MVFRALANLPVMLKIPNSKPTPSSALGAAPVPKALRTKKIGFKKILVVSTQELSKHSLQVHNGMYQTDYLFL